MNRQSKKKFLKAMTKIGLEKLCRIHAPDEPERHRGISGKREYALSYENITSVELATAQLIKPRKGSYISVRTACNWRRQKFLDL